MTGTTARDGKRVAGGGWRRVCRALGPGLIAGAADDDPSGIATYSQAGAQLGYALNWTILLTFPLTAAVQEISARIGRTTGKGIAGNIREHYPGWLLQRIVLLLVIANTINIGADVGAMGNAAALLAGGPQLVYVVAFGVVCTTLEITMPYGRHAAVLKWLTLALFAYFGTLMVIKVPWEEVAIGLVLPTFSWQASFWTMVLAIFDTTISPYLFFWRASQEVEETEAIVERKPLVDKPKQGPDAINRIRLDTVVGMAFSNLVALAIIVTSAATLNANGITDIDTASQAAEALRPIAGPFAFAVFTLGIVGTGLLAVPVLAGAAAYALAEARKWPLGLARQPRQAKAFYATIAVATLGGAMINFAPINPIKALIFSAVVNGVVAVPIMAIMMHMTANPKIMAAGCALPAGPRR
jgi:Mn2+/Fe2+ NRAMP family transporter